MATTTYKMYRFEIHLDHLVDWDDNPNDREPDVVIEVSYTPDELHMEPFNTFMEYCEGYGNEAFVTGYSFEIEED